MKTSHGPTISKTALRRAMIAAVFVLLPTMSAEAAMLAPGTPMTEFALTDQNGVAVGSADLSGKAYANVDPSTHATQVLEDR